MYAVIAKRVLDALANQHRAVWCKDSPVWMDESTAQKYADRFNHRTIAYKVMPLMGLSEDLYIDGTERFKLLAVRDLPIIAKYREFKGVTMLSEQAQTVVDLLKTNRHTVLRHIDTSDNGRVCHVAYWSGGRWEGLVVTPDERTVTYEDNDPNTGRVMSYGYAILDQLLENRLIQPVMYDKSQPAESVYVLTPDVTPIEQSEIELPSYPIIRRDGIIDDDNLLPVTDETKTVKKTSKKA